jgi:uncharacterized protein YjlB
MNLQADPQNENALIILNVNSFKSTDGGKTIRNLNVHHGDTHDVWINPKNPANFIIGDDGGAEVTFNDGFTFSDIDIPTAQFYHVHLDNDFPYNVYGGQQESGSVGIASRSNDGGITFREWHPVGVEEYGYVAADPLDPNIIYGGKITRFDKRTAQVQNISPTPVRDGKVRFIRTAPVLFSPVDNKTLFFAGNIIFKTINGGSSWETISPDLTRTTWDIPASEQILCRISL